MGAVSLTYSRDAINIRLNQAARGADAFGGVAEGIQAQQLDAFAGEKLNVMEGLLFLANMNTTDCAGQVTIDCRVQILEVVTDAVRITDELNCVA